MDYLAYPRGVWACWPILRGPVPAAILGNPAVVGITLGVLHQTIEKTQSVYDWTLLRQVLDQIAAQRPDLAMAIVLNHAPKLAPGWLKGQCQQIGMLQTSPYEKDQGSIVTAPVFWDPKFHAARLAWIRAAAAFCRSYPQILAATASHCNWNTDDVHLPGYQGTWNGLPVNQLGQWKAAGYNHATMLAQALEIVDAVAAGFPLIKLPVGTTSSVTDGTGIALCSQLAQAALSRYPGRVLVEQHGLMTRTPLANDPAIYSPLAPAATQLFRLVTPPCGLQLAASAMQNPTTGYRLSGGTVMDADSALRACIAIAQGYQSIFLELWPEDASATTLYPACQSFATAS